MMNSETSSSSRRNRRSGSGPKGGRTTAGSKTRGPGVAVGPTAGAGAAGREASGPAATSLQPGHLAIIGTFAAASAAALAAHGTRPANIAFIVLAVVVAGITAAAVYRTLWPLASDLGSSQPEMLGGRTRAALEREKATVLRAIKELEFDRAMGKVSQADCDEMIGRLRSRAVRLIRQLDAGSAGYRELIERELSARLGARSESAGNGRVPARIGGAAATATSGPPAASPFDDARGPLAARDQFEGAASFDQAQDLARLATGPMACAACGVENDPDAKFCKACGTKLGVPA
jgi:hypothetical protein